MSSKIFKDSNAKMYIDGKLVGEFKDVSINMNYHKPIKVLILDDTYVDATGDVMPTDAHVKYDRDVVLHKDFSDHWEDVIGVGRLFRQGNEFFVGDIHYSTPELEKIVKTAYLYPAIKGKKLEQKGNRLTQFTIDSIGLTLSPNVDNRIESVKTQLEDKDER